MVCYRWSDACLFTLNSRLHTNSSTAGGAVPASGHRSALTAILTMRHEPHEVPVQAEGDGELHRNRGTIRINPKSMICSSVSI